MIDNWADKIARFVCIYTKADKQMIEVYKYGIEVTISTLLNVLCVMLASILLCDILSGIVFLIVHFLIKPFVGGYQNAIEMVKTSLQQNAVPIIRVDDTSVLGYYDGEQFTHYMCISKVDTVNNTVTVVDPHYNATYRGTHVISMAEFEDLVNYDGWIALYTNAEDGYYVYE